MATPDGARKSLFGCGRFEKSRGFSGAANQPPWPNQKINRILKKCRLISLDRMTDELQDPSADEKRQGDPPIEKEEGPRNRNHRNAKRVTQFVHRVPMLGFVVFDEGSHQTSEW
jgi:hypothetical protein